MGNLNFAIHPALTLLAHKNHQMGFRHLLPYTKSCSVVSRKSRLPRIDTHKQPTFRAISRGKTATLRHSSRALVPSLELKEAIYHHFKSIDIVPMTLGYLGAEHWHVGTHVQQVAEEEKKVQVGNCL